MEESQTPDPKIQVRSLRADAPELNFVRSSWLRSFWQNYRGPEMDFAEFKASHTLYMRKLIEETTVRVIEFEGIEEVLGYSVADDMRQVAHWVYVKQPYRRQHLATALLKGNTRYTCDTPHGRRLAQSLSLKYNPYLR